jgi:hypothetical protein
MSSIFVDPNGNYWSIAITANGELQATQIPVLPSNPVTPVAEDVLTRVVQDADNTISVNHPALIGYLNRVQEQLLRAVQWTFLLSSTQTFTTVQNITDYYFGTGTCPSTASNTGLAIANFSKLDKKSVVDRTNSRQLGPVQEEPLGQVFTMPAFPRVFCYDTTVPFVLSLYPPPNNAFEIQFRYYIPRQVIQTPADSLQIPVEYSDVLVAGVNSLVAKLQNRDNDVLYWSQEYEKGKRDMVRDMHPYSIDMIRPDGSAPSSNYINAVDPPFFMQD